LSVHFLDTIALFLNSTNHKNNFHQISR